MRRMNVPDCLRRAAASAWLAYGLALLGGCCLAASIFPARLLFAWDGASGTSLTDPMQHIVGQRYFIADAWRWPLLTTKLLAGGTNIGLTDSIPIMALATKLLRGLLPPGFQTIFLWLAISYTVQPAAAVYAMRGAGERRLLPCLAAASVAGCMPVLFVRYGHAALSGQFLILLALGMYFRICAGRHRAHWIGIPALLLLALLVHPYLMAMVAALLAAAPLTLLLRADRRWLAAAGRIAAGIGLTGIVALLLGYGGLERQGGYGYFSMNLLQPFWPGRSALFPGAGYAPGTTTQFFEGYNYLGAGGLLLACVALFRVRAVPRHAGLLLACLVLAALAVSNHVMLGTKEIADLGDAPDIVQNFRASGRLFWPVAYVIIVVGALAAGCIGGGRGRRALSVAILLAAGVLQIADTTLLRRDVATAMRTAPPLATDIAALRPMLATHRSFTILPIFGCGAEHDDGTFMHMLLLASETAIPVNTMYAARVRQQPICDDAVARSPLRAGELRLFNPATAYTPFPDSDRFCRELGRFVICARDAGDVPGSQPVGALVLPAIPPDLIVSATSSGFASFLAYDWAHQEPTGLWSNGRVASIEGRLDKPFAGPARFSIRAHGYPPLRGGTQSISVSINDHAVARWAMPEQDAEYEADIPADVDLSGPIRVRFEIAQPTRPIDRDQVGDPRWLGLWISAFRIAPR